MCTQLLMYVIAHRGVWTLNSAWRPLEEREISREHRQDRPEIMTQAILEHMEEEECAVCQCNH